MIPQGTTATSLLASVIKDFNTKLLTYAASFKANNTGVTTWVWDSNTYFNTILNNPTAYGFADATSYGSAPTDFWGNNLHPSSYAHKFFGQQVGALLGNTVW